MPWALHMRVHVCTHSHVNAHACTSLCTWMAKCLLGPARAFHQNIWGCRAGARHWGLTYTPGGSLCPGAASGGVLGVPGPPLGISTFLPSRCLLSAAGSLPPRRGL